MAHAKMSNGHDDRGRPTLEWSIGQLQDYLSAKIDFDAFWEPIPQILRTYIDDPDDPSDRLVYCWRQIGIDGGAIRRLGYPEEPDFRNYIAKWLKALHLSKADWEALVKRKGRPLADNTEDWDA